MLSKKLYFIFGFSAVIILFLVGVVLPYRYNWVSIFIVPFVLLLSLTYVFSPQIDWWWFQKNPPELPLPLGNLLIQHFPFYQKLSAENKKRFRQRTAMYMEAREFRALRGGEDDTVPADIQTMIAANVVMLTFGRKDFILKKFERIFIYLQAFPSPNHPYLHSSELNEEDKCFLFSGEHILLSFRQPERFYNIILHEVSRAFVLTFSQYDYPNFDEKIWNSSEQKAIATFLGKPEEKINLLGVSVNFFFSAPQMFKKSMPQQFEQFQAIFNLNPLENTDPVIDKSVIANVP